MHPKVAMVLISEAKEIVKFSLLVRGLTQAVGFAPAATNSSVHVVLLLLVSVWKFRPRDLWLEPSFDAIDEFEHLIECQLLIAVDVIHEKRIIHQIFHFFTDCLQFQHNFFVVQSQEIRFLHCSNDAAVQVHRSLRDLDLRILGIFGLDRFFKRFGDCFFETAVRNKDLVIGGFVLRMRFFELC